jgi:hypothetical protein
MNNIKLVGVIFLIWTVAISRTCVLKNTKVIKKKLLIRAHYKFLRNNKDVKWVSIFLVPRLTLLNACLEGENAIQKFANMFGFQKRKQLFYLKLLFLVSASGWTRFSHKSIWIIYFSLSSFHNMAICHFYGCLWPPVFSQQECKSP